MPEAQDAQLEIKKRARRRLVGAIALSLLAAIVFPLVMDDDPGPMVQDIEIKIPGQDDRTLNNHLALQPPPDDVPTNTPPPVAAPPLPVTEPTAVTPPASNEPAAPTGKPVPPESSERALDILNGKTPENTDKSRPNDLFVILIGAYANEGNVKVLRNKMTEIGIKSYTEPLGDKTRVRAGPFPSREAAEKALQKMKVIGVSGQISSK